MPNPDNIKLLYNELKNSYDIESEDAFREYLSDANNREALRKELEADYDVGDSVSFASYLGFGNEPAPQEPAKPVEEKKPNVEYDTDTIMSDGTVVPGKPTTASAEDEYDDSTYEERMRGYQAGADIGANIGHIALEGQITELKKENEALKNKPKEAPLQTADTTQEQPQPQPQEEAPQAPQNAQETQKASQRYLIIKGKKTPVTEEVYQDFMRRHPSGRSDDKAKAKPQQGRNIMTASEIINNTPWNTRNVGDNKAVNEEWKAAKRNVATTMDNMVNHPEGKGYQWKFRQEALRRMDNAEFQRRVRGEEFDNTDNNFETFYQTSVAPTFKTERAKADAEGNRAAAQYPSVTDARGMTVPNVMAAAAYEKATDPAVVTQNVLSNLDGNALSQYVERRMHVDEQPIEGGIERQLTEEELQLVRDLIAAENGDVVSKLQQRMYQDYINEGGNMTTAGYILGNGFRNSLLMRLQDAIVTRIAGSSGLRKQFLDMAYQRAGEKAGAIARGVSGAVTMIADAPAFGVAGKVAAPIAKGVIGTAGKAIAGRAAGELGAAAAERFIVTNSRIGRIAESMLHSGFTLSGYDVMSEGVNQFQQGQFDAGELVNRAIKGFGTGAAVGWIGGATGELTRNLTGLAKNAVKAFGFASEVGLFTGLQGLEMAVEMGVPISEIDWGALTIENAAMLGVLKLQSMAQRARMAEGLDLSLNEYDIEELRRRGYDFSTVTEGLRSLKSINSGGEVDFIDKSGKPIYNAGEQKKINAMYAKLLADKDVPIDVKRKVRFYLEGEFTPYEPVFGMSEVRINQDETATLETYSADGSVISREHFGNVAEAENRRVGLMDEIAVNQIQAYQKLAEHPLSNLHSVANLMSSSSQENERLWDIIDRANRGEELTQEELDTYLDMYQSATEYGKKTRAEIFGEASENVRRSTGIDVNSLLSDKERRAVDWTPQERDAVNDYLDLIGKILEARGIVAEMQMSGKRASNRVKLEGVPEQPVSAEEQGTTGPDGGGAETPAGVQEKSVSAEAALLGLNDGARIKKAIEDVVDRGGDVTSELAIVLSGVSDAERQIILDYVKAYSTRKGVVDRANEEAERMRQDTRERFNGAEHEDGTVTMAVLSWGERVVLVNENNESDLVNCVRPDGTTVTVKKNNVVSTGSVVLDDLVNNIVGNQIDAFLNNIASTFVEYKHEETPPAGENPPTGEPQGTVENEPEEVEDRVDNPVDARNRGYRTVDGQRYERQGEQGGAYGNEQEVRFSNRPDGLVKTRNKVVSAETLQPSHIGGQRNLWFFLDDAQPKDRANNISSGAEDRIASNIRPEEITTGSTAYVGAPVVNRRHETIQGNNRTAALKKMWESYPEQAERYRQYLLDHAEELGLNREEIEGIEHPVLVRESDMSDEDAVRYGQFTAQDTETGGEIRIDPRTLIGKIGDKFSHFVDVLLESEDEADTMSSRVSANGVKALDLLRDIGAIDETEYASAVENGNLTRLGKEELLDVLNKNLFGNRKNVENAFYSLPNKVQKAIFSTFAYNYRVPDGSSIMKEIQDSILAMQELLDQHGDVLRNSGVPISARADELKKGTDLTSLDGTVSIEKYYGYYTLSVPKTKKDGAKYFENEELLSYIEGNNFYPYRGKLRGDIALSDIDGVLAVLSNLGVRVEEGARASEQIEFDSNGTADTNGESGNGGVVRVIPDRTVRMVTEATNEIDKELPHGAVNYSILDEDDIDDLCDEMGWGDARRRLIHEEFNRTPNVKGVYFETDGVFITFVPYVGSKEGLKATKFHENVHHAIHELGIDPGDLRLKEAKSVFERFTEGENGIDGRKRVEEIEGAYREDERAEEIFCYLLQSIYEKGGLDLVESINFANNKALTTLIRDVINFLKSEDTDENKQRKEEGNRRFQSQVRSENFGPSPRNEYGNGGSSQTGGRGGQAGRGGSLGEGEARAGGEVDESRWNPVDAARENVERRSERGERIHRRISFGRKRDVDEVAESLGVANAYYEAQLRSSKYQMQEALQDSMLSLRELQKGIELETGEPIRDYENAYLGEAALSSKTRTELEEYKRDFLSPMFEALTDFMHALVPDGKGKKWREHALNEVTRYVIALHGLERNEVFAMRDAERTASAMFDSRIDEAQRLADADPTDVTLQTVVDNLRQAKQDLIDQQYEKNRERDYSGLTEMFDVDNVGDAEMMAQALVDQAEDGRGEEMADLWDAINKATDRLLQKQYDSGLISLAEYNRAKTMFNYYIPLRGFDDTVGEDIYEYLNNGDSRLNGPVYRAAKGRSSTSDNPFANLMNMADAAFSQGNRNVMKQMFLWMVQGHKTNAVSVSDLWLAKNDATDEWEVIFPEYANETLLKDVNEGVENFNAQMEALAKAEPDKYKRAREHPHIPYRIVNRKDKQQHSVIVKQGGRAYILTINGNPRAAMALNGLTNPNMRNEETVGALMRQLQKMNRFLSQAFTTWSPDFVVSNFMRDFLYSNIMVHVNEKGDYARRFHLNHIKVNPARMVSLLRKYERDELDMSNPTEEAFQEFMQAGGETGYNSQRADLDEYKSDLMKELRFTDREARKFVSWIWDGLQRVNRGVELSARFAAFMTSKQMGRSQVRAVWDAKNISVNFNKKGSGDKFRTATGQTKAGKAAASVSGIGRNLYVFWNAGVQGVSNFLRTFANKDTRKRAVRTAMAVTMVGAIVSLLHYLLDDDDDGNYFDLPPYVRRDNISFRAGRSAITLPLPIELRGLYGMGEMLMSMALGKDRYTGGEFTLEMMNQFAQMLPLNPIEGRGMMFLVPTGIKPPVEAQMNTKWTGTPIQKETTPSNKHYPEYTKSFTTVDKDLYQFTKWLNERGGGDDYSSGGFWFDWSPAKMEYVFNGYFGGPMKLGTQLKHLIEDATGDKEFEWRDVPLLNRFVKGVDSKARVRAVDSEFFDNVDKYKVFQAKLSGYKKAADGPDPYEAAKYRDKLSKLEQSEEYKKFDAFNELDKDIMEINKGLDSGDYSTDYNDTVLYKKRLANEVMRRSGKDLDELLVEIFGSINTDEGNQ